MEESISKVVNFGIGTVKTISEAAQDVLGQVQGQLDEFIAIGESASDEGSAKVKEVVNKALDSYKDIEANIKQTTEEVISKIKELNPQSSKETTETTEAKAA